MKKTLALLLILIVVFTLSDIPTAQARAVGVSIHGSSSVKVGSTTSYTLKYGFANCRIVVVSISSSDSSVLAVSGSSAFTAYSGIPASYSGQKSVKLKAKKAGTVTLTAKISADTASGGTSSFTATMKVTVSGSSGSSITATPVPTASPTPTETPNPDAPKNWYHAEYVLERRGGQDLEFTMSEGMTDITDDVISLLGWQNSTLTVNYENYSVIIDGNDVNNDALDGISSIDISLSTETKSTLSETANGEDVIQLHFEDFGELPCIISYKFKAEEFDPYDIMYLYQYINDEDVFEACGYFEVDADGYITVSVSHFSSYILTCSYLDSAQNNEVLYTPTPSPTATPSPTPTPSPLPTATPTLTPSGSPTLEPAASLENESLDKLAYAAFMLALAVILGAGIFVAVKLIKS